MTDCLTFTIFFDKLWGYGKEQIFINYLEVKEWLDKLSKEKFRNDIFNNLLTSYKSTNHKTVYL